MCVVAVRQLCRASGTVLRCGWRIAVPGLCVAAADVCGDGAVLRCGVVCGAGAVLRQRRLCCGAVLCVVTAVDVCSTGTVLRCGVVCGDGAVCGAGAVSCFRYCVAATAGVLR